MVISTSTSVDNIYPTALVLELIERTKRCAIVWFKESLDIYQTNWTVGNKNYVASVVHMQYKYQLSVSLNNRPIYTVDSGIIPEIIDLYLVLGLMINQTNDALTAIQNQAPCDQIDGSITFTYGFGIWIVPSNIHKVVLQVWGAGGAGGNVSRNSIPLSLFNSEEIFEEVVLTAQTANAVIPSQFTESSFAANDDYSTGLISIGFNANFFGLMFSQIYINNNGNITFSEPLQTYTPYPIVSNALAMIAPFFADVDTRSGNVVTYGTGTVNGNNAFGINWIDVKHYDSSDPSNGFPTNTFQLVLIDRSDLAAGDFDFEFNYNSILWETGTASGGDANGLGGSSARVGYTNGTDASYEFAGSAVNGALLDGGPSDTSLIQNSFNSGGVLGRYLFRVRDGIVVNTPLSNGGLVTGGVADNTVVSTNLSSGGLVSGGNANFADVGQTIVGTGGVVVGGLSDSKSVAFSQGGVKVGGAALISVISTVGGGGGGGGGYTTQELTVYTGQQFIYSIGAGGNATTAPTDTTVRIETTTFTAYAGTSGVLTSGGVGGAFSGGTGVNGTNGLDATGDAGGSGGSAYLGGKGGDAGANGFSPGGGGGGPTADLSIGNGSNGQVTITYSE